MEGMLGEAALARAVEQYCAEDSSESDRNESLNTVLVQVHRGEVGLNELVAGHLRSYLTNEEGFVRMRGTKLLAQVLQRLPDLKLTDKVMQALLSFFIERFSSDYESSAPCVLALKAIVELHEKEFDTTFTSKLVNTLLTAHHVPAMTQSLRSSIYQAMDVVLNKERTVAALREQVEGFELVQWYADAMDAEKDPRCLLICLKVAAKLAVEGTLRFDSQDNEERAVERIFDVSCVYFPIVFRPPANDPYNIRAEDLWDVLHQVFSSHTFMAPHVIGLLVDKLNISSSDVAMAKVDSLKTLQVCLPAYGYSGISPYLAELREVLTRLVVNAELASIAEEGIQAISVITAMVAKQTEVVHLVSTSEPQLPQGWTDFVVALVSDCTDSVAKSIDSMVGRASARILAAMGQASPLSLGFVLDKTVPLARKWCLRPDAEESQRSAAFDLLARLIHAINPDVAYAADFNPMKPEHVASIFEVLVAEVSRSMMDTVYDDSTFEGARPRSGSVAALSTKKTAIKALQDLLVRPPTALLSTEQISDSVKAFSDLLVDSSFSSQEREYLRTSCLEALIAVGNAGGVCADTVSEVTVPMVENAADGLDILADLCAIPRVFDTVMPHMLDQTTLERKNRTVDQKLLSIIAEIVEKNKTYTEGLERCCVPFTPNTLFAALVHGAKTDVFTLGEAGARIIRRLTRNVSADVQKQMLTHVLDQVPMEISTLANQGIFVLTAVLGSLRAEIFSAEGAVDVSNVLHVCQQLGLDTNISATVRETAAQCLASVINKIDSTAYQATIAKTTSSFLASCDASQGEDSRLAVMDALTWYAKGLAMRGHPDAQAICDKVVDILCHDENEAFLFKAAELFGNIIRPSTTILNRESHAKEILFFQQKFYGANFKRVRDLLSSSSTGSIGVQQRSALLLAAVRILEFVPRGILLQDIESNLVFLTQALSESSTTIKTSALVSLAVIIENNLDAAEPYLGTLVPLLLDLTKFRPGVLAKHRVLAINCLLEFSSLPYNKIHSLRQKVSRGLLDALDDPKRPVRKQAVECRNKWLILQNV